MNPTGKCPPRIIILTLLDSGREVPHLAECEECRAFANAALGAVSSFVSIEEFERVLADFLDEVLADTPPRRWYSALLSKPELHRTAVVRELLRRADAWYGKNPRLGSEMTAAAVALCDAMARTATGINPLLRIEALKDHAMLLCRIGALADSERTLERAMNVVPEVPEVEQQHQRAIVTLCRAILFTEPDYALFDHAIELAAGAARILTRCNDERRALLAHQTHAYVLHAMNDFPGALSILSTIIQRLEEIGSVRDVASAHGLLAHCLVGVGEYTDALRHAKASEFRYLEIGDTIGAARVSHTAARATAASGDFESVRLEFDRAAEVIFRAKLFDVWSIMRLDYVAAALSHDESADVRAEVESVARVALTLNANESTQRRRFAAEAIDYLRMIATRDAVTREAVDYVRAFVIRNASRPPVKFTPPTSGASFLM